MNNKFKILLIAIEVFLLLALLLLGVGCQRRWFIVTDDGPRFDWYTLVETTPPTDSKPTDDTQREPADDPTEDKPEPTATSQPTQTTWQPGSSNQEPEMTTTEPEETTIPEDSSSKEPEGTADPGVDEFPLVPMD